MQKFDDTRLEPQQIFQTSVWNLYLSNLLVREEIGQMTWLVDLSVAFNGIRQLPASLSELR